MSKQKQHGKICDRCQNLAGILYRVRVDTSGDWIFVCLECWPLASENNPHYIYGGTWKQRRKSGK